MTTDEGAQMTTTYDTAGERPQRTITQRAGGLIVMMMTEIDEGVFVGWDRCAHCTARVADCRCSGGPTEREVIARWRQERLDKVASRRPPVSGRTIQEQPDAEPEPADSDTRQETEPDEREARAASIPVDF